MSLPITWGGLWSEFLRQRSRSCRPWPSWWRRWPNISQQYPGQTAVSINHQQIRLRREFCDLKVKHQRKEDTTLQNALSNLTNFRCLTSKFYRRLTTAHVAHDSFTSSTPAAMRIQFASTSGYGWGR